MTRLAGTEIFWTTLLVLFAILALANLIGRLWSPAFPPRLQEAARLYLSPVMGLAILTIVAGIVGRHLALGNTIAVPAASAALLATALYFEKNLSEAGRHLAYITLFAIICGTSVLAPLYVYGALNSHNDTFTYLAQGNWLQGHAFSETISADNATPSSTQVALYQAAGLRMGASFLLAFFQALLNLRWSSAIYPALVIAGVSACCLAIGFPIARRLRVLRLDLQLALLALPALSVGGLVFGANYGFLPQTFGLAFGGAALFAAGPLLTKATRAEATLQVVGAAIPVSLLLVAAIFSYSEIVPFLFAALGISGLFVACKSNSKRNVLLFGISLAVATLMVTNTELVRLYSALLMQAGAVVGSPVDWRPTSFFAHGIGVHAGAWDSIELNYFGLVWAVLVGIIFVVIVVKTPGREPWPDSVAVVPALTILVVFAVTFLYFRYGVASPFPVGVGQSWSQFKLAEWAHPFLSLILLAGLCSRLTFASHRRGPVILALVFFTTVAAGVGAIARTKPLMDYYRGVNNLEAFYGDFRKAVSESCPPLAPIYLKLNGSHLKFRQMAALYLEDRVLRSDWKDDGYIFPLLPSDQRQAKLEKGDCIVEPIEDGGLELPVVVGPFRVGMFDGRNRFFLSSSSGDYGQEGTVTDRWWWVRQSARFKFEPLLQSEGSPVMARITFGYRVRTDQTLVVEVGDDDHLLHKFTVKGRTDMPARFDEGVSIPYGRPIVVRISTDGISSSLSLGDSRSAAFVVQNVSIVVPN